MESKRSEGIFGAECERKIFFFRQRKRQKKKRDGMQGENFKKQTERIIFSSFETERAKENRQKVRRDRDRENEKTEGKENREKN